jgi:hypothetical protein
MDGHIRAIEKGYTGNATHSRRENVFSRFFKMISLSGTKAKIIEVPKFWLGFLDTMDSILY